MKIIIKDFKSKLVILALIVYLSKNYEQIKII